MPDNIVSDRDPVFVSKSWQELFSAHGVTLSTSTAYHPQSDGQTEVLNRSLETYLRCYCTDSPQDWFFYLPLFEYWYKTIHHSAINTSSYESLYGQPPPIHLPYLPCEVTDEQVNKSLLTRELKTQLLKFHLSKAQQRVISLANNHRSDRVFSVGDWIYLKVQPYRQVSLYFIHFNKLTAKYYGPYQVLQKIGPIAYKLALPSHVTIHPTFHVSLLKPCHKLPETFNLPPVLEFSSPYFPNPKAIKDRRMSKKGNKAITQVLVQWTQLPEDQLTWEDLHSLQTRFPNFFLEDKEVLEEMGNDANGNEVRNVGVEEEEVP